MIELHQINTDSVEWSFLYTQSGPNDVCMLPGLLDLSINQVLKRGVDFLQFSRRISQHIIIYLI